MKAFIEGICGTHGDRVCLVAAAIVREDGKYVEFGVRKHFGVLKMLKEALSPAMYERYRYFMIDTNRTFWFESTPDLEARLDPVLSGVDEVWGWDAHWMVIGLNLLLPHGVELNPAFNALGSIPRDVRLLSPAPSLEDRRERSHYSSLLDRAAWCSKMVYRASWSSPIKPIPCPLV